MLLYRCMARCCAPEPGAFNGGGDRRQRFLTIDLHCHALNLEVEALVADCPQRKAEPEMMARTLGEESARHNATTMLPSVMPKLTQPQLRLADMDAMGVDLQVVSPSPNQYYYWAEEALGPVNTSSAHQRQGRS